MKIKLLTETAQIPKQATDFSAGYDLVADEDIKLYPGEWRAISTGLSMNIPKGIFGAIYPRSGLSTKHNIVLKNSTGIIDSDYINEIKVCLHNTGSEPFDVVKGMRIAQMVFQAHFKFAMKVVDELDVISDRSGGFGSTKGF